MKNIFLFILFFFAVPSAYAVTDIEFIIDFSGSMNAVEGGEKRIETARKALNTALEAIPAGTHTAVRVYSHRVEQAKKDESCKDTELVIPFAPVNAAAIREKINSLTPKGWTPIAYSLQVAQSDFNLTREATKVINVLTDGEETCGGDAVAVLNKMKAEGFDVTVNVIGFAIKPELKAQLEAIAAAGGGKYYDAQNGEQLIDSLKKATEQSLLIKKEKTVYGNEIRGGNSYETAVALEIGKEYRLDHHQKKNEYDYFFIDLKAQQKVTLQAATLEKGVHIQEDGKVAETDAPYAGIQIHDATRNKLKYITLIGNKNKVEKVSVTVSAEGRYYVLVGNDYEAQHKDHVTFTVTVESEGDLGSSNDASDEVSGALAIEPKKYPVNFLGGIDKVDVFSFTAKKGESYFVGVVPSGQPKGAYQVTVWDEYKQNVHDETGPYNSGFKTKSFLIPTDGKYYLRIKNDYLDTHEAYLLELGLSPVP